MPRFTVCVELIFEEIEADTPHQACCWCETLLWSKPAEAMARADAIGSHCENLSTGNQKTGIPAIDRVV